MKNQTSISIMTPTSRFSCNTRICWSMSDKDPDTWNPIGSVLTTGQSRRLDLLTLQRVKVELAAGSKKYDTNDNSRLAAIFSELVAQSKNDIMALEADTRKLEIPAAQQHETGTSASKAAEIYLEDGARLLVREENQEPGAFQLTVVGVIRVAAVAFCGYIF